MFGGLRPLIDRADHAAFYCCDILSLFLFDKFCMPLYRAARSFLCRVLREDLLSGAAFALRVIVRVLALGLAGALKWVAERVLRSFSR